MNAKFSKRLMAYIFDIIVVVIVLSFFGMFMPANENVDTLNLELDMINEKLLKDEISISNYFYQYADIMYQLDKNGIMFTIINAVLILGYFVLIPYLNSGQTFGKKWMKIRVVKDDDSDATPNDLIMRNMITNGLLYILIGLASIYLLPSFSYFLVIAIFGIIQIVVVIYSVFMILYKQDRKGLHDIVTKTKVVECK